MPSLRECKCCRECFNLLEEKLDSINCISEHEEFVQLCSNKIVLNTTFIQHRRTKKNYKRVKSMTNKYVDLLTYFIHTGYESCRCFYYHYRRNIWLRSSIIRIIIFIYYNVFFVCLYSFLPFMPSIFFSLGSASIKWSYFTYIWLNLFMPPLYKK